MSNVENLSDHMAYTCSCGSVNFCLLRSGLVECNKCQARPAMTWSNDEPDEPSQCQECYGKGWNDKWHEVMDGFGQVFKDECQACEGTGVSK